MLGKNQLNYLIKHATLEAEKKKKETKKNNDIQFLQKDDDAYDRDMLDFNQ